jgi:predicted DNA-binding protein YlxM (UPF0122 family)
MAIKVNTTTVINDSRQLQNIASTDTTTASAINQAIKNQNNSLIIYDSANNVVRTIYGAV